MDPGDGVGGLLRFLARMAGARAVVEVDPEDDASGLGLLEGMDRGTLSSVVDDAERQSRAQRAYAQAGVGDRVRSMLGAPLDVLPRLADANYDLVFLDGPRADYPQLLTHARRLLRPGGLLVADDVMAEGDDPDAQGARALVAAVEEDPALDAVVLPMGSGVLIAR